MNSVTDLKFGPIIVFATTLFLTGCGHSVVPSSDVLARGQDLYAVHCIQCHTDGTGSTVNPPLIGSSKLTGPASGTIRNILYGQVHETSVKGIMPPMGYLTDQEIADVATYVRSTFARNHQTVTPEEVAIHRANPPR
jgi:mono/diheme cytochrome c family protein